MQATAQQSHRAPDGTPLHDEPHRPEQTALYRLVQQHAASFLAHTEAPAGMVPEPATLALFTVGLLGLGSYAKQRRHKR